MFLSAALLFRVPTSAGQPWMLVLLLAILNEFMDVQVEWWGDPRMQFSEGAKDLILTMLLPTVLMVTARYLPRLYRSTESSLDRADNPQQESRLPTLPQ